MTEQAFGYAALRDRIESIFAGQLFFVAGTVKSGTTWLQLMLDGHREVSCRGEGHFTHFLLPSLRRALNEYNRRIDGTNKVIFSEIEGYPLLREEHLNFLLASGIGLLLAEQIGEAAPLAVGEKTPDNIRSLDLLRTLFPRAKFLHIVRDGRDVAVSAWFHNLRLDADWTRKTFGSLAGYVRDYASIWAREIGQARAFAAKHPDQYLEFRYEDLHRDPAPILRGALEFLGVDASDGAIAGCREAGAFERLSGGRKWGEEDPESLFRKGVSGDWKNHFDDQMRAAFTAAAGDLLRDLGYEP